METLGKRLLSLWRVLKASRAWLGGSYFEYLIVFVVFLLISIALTNFVALHITTQVFTLDPGDGTGGFLWYNFAQPGLDLVLHQSILVNYPYGEPIGGPTFLTYMALWLPMRVLAFLFGAIAGANLFMLLGFTLTAVSMYWLIKRITKSWQVAVFAGYAAAFTPYAMQKSLDHVAYILAYVFVFMVAGFIAIWMRPTRLRAVLLGLVIAISFYTDGYYLLLGSVLVACMVVGGLIFSVLVGMPWSEVWRRVKALSLAALTLIILLSPILFLQLTQGSQIKQSLEGRRLDLSLEMHTYRANVIDFILPSKWHPLFEKNDTYYALQEIKNQRSNPSENTNYLGFTLIILLAVGGTLFAVWLFARKHASVTKMPLLDRNKFLLIGCITLVSVPVMLSFMFSPEIIVRGVTIPLPGHFLISHDITLWRVMSRFFVTLHVIIVIFAAISLWVALVTLRAKKVKKVKRRRGVVTTSIVAILLVILAFEYATNVNRPSYDFSKLDRGYTWLKDQKDINVVAELPVIDPFDVKTAAYVTAQVVHGKKLVNFKETTSALLTDVVGGISNPETIDWAYGRGAQALITHDQPCKSVEWGRVLFNDSSMCIYSLERPVTKDKVYIRYGSGFLHRPNADNQELAIMGGASAKFEVTDDNFKAIKKSGMAYVTSKLSGLDREHAWAKWRIIQNNKTVSEGEINGDPILLHAEVDLRYPIELQLEPVQGETSLRSGFMLSQTVVTML